MFCSLELEHIYILPFTEKNTGKYPCLHWDTFTLTGLKQETLRTLVINLHNDNKAIIKRSRRKSKIKGIHPNQLGGGATPTRTESSLTTVTFCMF